MHKVKYHLKVTFKTANLTENPNLRPHKQNNPKFISIKLFRKQKALIDTRY